MIAKLDRTLQLMHNKTKTNHKSERSMFDMNATDRMIMTYPYILGIIFRAPYRDDFFYLFLIMVTFVLAFRFRVQELINASVIMLYIQGHL